MKRRSKVPGEDALIFDWNRQAQIHRPAQTFDLLDETLRDGVQSPSVTDPDVSHKLELVELMAAVGIGALDIGLPGAGERAFGDVVAIAKHILHQGLPLEPMCAARTLRQDIRPIVEAVHRTGQPIWVYSFIGSSPIRLWTENWDLPFLLQSSREAVKFAVREGLDVAYVTEDTTRTPPHVLEPLFQNALDCGAKRLTLCDTVGHATPDGVKQLVRWTLDLLRRWGRTDVKVDFHGHNDRGLGVINALAALEAGAHRIHGCGLGMGERVGNTAMDQLLVNLTLLGWMEHDQTRLIDYVKKIGEACKVPIPANYPLAGEDAFRTATGVHAAAIAKAQAKGDEWLADRIYSGVPAGLFGRSQIIEVGPMSGLSNVRWWLKARGVRPSDSLCEEVIAVAKASNRLLTEQEILDVVRLHRRGAVPTPSPLSSSPASGVRAVRPVAPPALPQRSAPRALGRILSP